MNTIASRRSIGGIDKLVLRFPTGALKGAGSSLAMAMNEEGRLIRFALGGAGSAPSWARWRFEDLLQEEDAGLLIGPDFPRADGPGASGAAWLSLDDAAGMDEGLDLLLKAARGFQALATDKALPRGIVSSGLLFSPSGEELLVLPPQAAAKALAATGAGARGAAAARLLSPLADSPEADASFLLAQAAYRFATGKGAYGAMAEEPGSVAPSRPFEVAAVLASPRLDPALASLVDAALSDPRKASLSSWAAALDAARVRGWSRALSEGEAAELERRRAAAEAEAAAKRRRADFWRKRGGIVVAAAVAIAVLGFVAADMLRAQRDKPNFADLPADQLVLRYYKAIDDIDIDSLEACGNKKAFESDYNYIMNVTVLAKTRLAYEGKSPVVPAQKWVTDGKPALDPTAFLYGVAGLSVVKEEGRGVDGALYRATYSFWSIDHKEDASGDPSKTTASPLEEKRVDLLALERSPKWKGWRITSLERKVAP
jgi:hypothetical protein